jgi:tetratricopeptide (TPR) repeat protein
MRAVALVFLLATGCGFGSGNVSRVYWGKPVEGRYIAPEAYAHYAQGALDEASGDDASAAGEYRAALGIDPESADTWTRLGAVRCRAKGSDADAAFAAAESLDPELASLWRERARCALLRGDAKRARQMARRAITFDPSDEASSLALVEAELDLGHRDEALRWLRGLVTTNPSSGAAKKLLERISGVPAKRGERPSVADVERALSEGSADVRKLSLAAGLSPSLLALHAAKVGRTDVAKRVSAEVLDADSNDSDAWIAALSAAWLDRDATAFEATLGRLGDEPSTPSTLGAELLGNLLEGRLGADAGRAWRDAAAAELTRAQ